MRRQITPGKILVMGGHWEKKNWEFKEFRWNSVFSLGYLWSSPFLRQKKTKWRITQKTLRGLTATIGQIIVLLSGRDGSCPEEQESLDARGICGGGILLFGSFHSFLFLNSGVLPSLLGYLTHLYLFISWKNSSRTSYTPSPVSPGEIHTSIRTPSWGNTYIKFLSSL